MVRVRLDGLVGNERREQVRRLPASNPPTIRLVVAANTDNKTN